MRCHAVLPILCSVLAAQAPAPGAPVTPAQRAAVVEALGAALRARYVFPDVGERVARALAEKAAQGAYAAQATAPAFAEALHQDLRALGKDSHFRVRYAPDFKPADPGDEDRAPTPEALAQLRTDVQQKAFGIARVEQLQGNIGYVDLRGFGPAEFVGPAFSAVLQLVSGTEALILDLRQNGGGDPEAVAFLVSHFFPEGDSRHLNSIYSRPRDATRQFWTSPAASPRYARPLYVLTSAFTFSGGEECAYDLQTQKRATLVGETTGGGANPGSVVALAHGFVAFIPSGRAINPVTRTNWEHEGVKPDLASTAEGALKVAHLAALRAILEKEKSPGYRGRLEAWIGQVERGEAEPPRWKRR